MSLAAEGAGTAVVSQDHDATKASPEEALTVRPSGGADGPGPPHLPAARSWDPGSLRRWVAAAGVAASLVLGVVPRGAAAVTSMLAFAFLTMETAVGWIEIRSARPRHGYCTSRRERQPTTPAEIPLEEPQGRRPRSLWSFPTRSAERTLAPCLRSLRPQSYPYRTVVVDNGFTDGTRTSATPGPDAVLQAGSERSARCTHAVCSHPTNVVGFVVADMILAPTVELEGHR